jgi:uncharacterized tellurite resistance protein B-like protein
MIDRLLRLLEGRESPNAAPTDEDLRIAVAALLVETARMDQSFGDAERAVIASLLTNRFGLPAAAVSSLITGGQACRGFGAVLPLHAQH